MDCWPLFDLRITTPRLELRYVSDGAADFDHLLQSNGVIWPESGAITASALHSMRWLHPSQIG